MAATTEWEDLCKYGNVLRGVQDLLLEQSRAGKIADAIGPNEPNTPATKIFAIESALMPFGSIGHVAAELRSKGGYSKLADQVRDDRVLSQLSTDHMSRSRAGEFARMFKGHAKDVIDFVELISKGEQVLPRPYGSFLDFDMEAWALTCLLDMKDVFFKRRLDDTLAADEEMDNKINELVSARLEAIQTQGIRGINEIERVGWYANVTTMVRLNEVRTAPARLIGGLKGSSKGLAEALGRVRDKPAELIKELMQQPAFIETTLLSTRAVCAFVVLGQDLLDVESKKESERNAAQAFRDLETEEGGLGHDGFAGFCFRKLREYHNKDQFTLGLFDVDGFIHLTGIIAFALSKGYFSPAIESGGVATKDKDAFRTSIDTRGYKDRADVISALLLAYENTLRGYLSRTDGELYRSKNRFIATHDLARIYDDSGRPRPLVANKDKVEIGTDSDRNYHSFEYLVTLPIAIKALAQLSYSERFGKMVAAKPEQWAELKFPEWLARIEELGGDLVEVMLKVHIRDNGNHFWGVWQEEHDWSVTAAVVDALSLWCGSLACRWAYNEQTAGEGVGEQIDPAERKVVSDFFRLIRSRTRTPPAPQSAPAGATALSAEAKETLDWLRTLRKLSNMALNFRPADASSDPEKENLEIEHVFMLASMVGQVKYALEQSDGDAELFNFISQSLDDAMRTKASSGERFSNVRREIIEKYPGAFPEVELPNSAEAEPPRKRDGKRQVPR